MPSVVRNIDSRLSVLRAYAHSNRVCNPFACVRTAANAVYCQKGTGTSHGHVQTVCDQLAFRSDVVIDTGNHNDFRFVAFV